MSGTPSCSVPLAVKVRPDAPRHRAAPSQGPRGGACRPDRFPQDQDALPAWRCPPEVVTVRSRISAGTIGNVCLQRHGGRALQQTVSLGLTDLEIAPAERDGQAPRPMRQGADARALPSAAPEKPAPRTERSGIEKPKSRSAEVLLIWPAPEAVTAAEGHIESPDAGAGGVAHHIERQAGLALQKSVKLACPAESSVPVTLS